MPWRLLINPIFDPSRSKVALGFREVVAQLRGVVRRGVSATGPALAVCQIFNQGPRMCLWSEHHRIAEHDAIRRSRVLESSQISGWTSRKGSSGTDWRPEYAASLFEQLLIEAEAAQRALQEAICWARLPDSRPSPSTLLVLELRAVWLAGPLPGDTVGHHWLQQLSKTETGSNCIKRIRISVRTIEGETLIYIRRHNGDAGKSSLHSASQSSRYRRA